MRVVTKKREVVTLPLKFRLANRIGDLLKIERLPRFRFEEGLLLKLACRKTGLCDFGDDYFREGFQVLVQSLQKEVDLHPVGRLGIHQMVVTQLANRLLFAEAKKKNPGAFSKEITPPLIILGLPRSGTTLLHRLLSQDPAHRGLGFWQLMRPFPASGSENSRREVEKALRVRRQMDPSLDRKHFIRADSYEECMWLMQLTFVSHGYWIAAPVYSYLSWLSSRKADRIRAYQEYRQTLGYLQAGDRRRLILKAPSHSGSLRELIHAVPEARIIQTHRDPLEAAASFMSLTLTAQRVVMREVDIERMARANLKSLIYEGKRTLLARRRIGNPIFDLSYDELVSDPVGSVRSVYSFFDLQWTDEFERCLNTYIENHPKNKHGKHSYRLEEFGLEREDLARISKIFGEGLNGAAASRIHSQNNL